MVAPGCGMKVFLKQAREALGSKEYERALNVVETGLADDEVFEPENKPHYYMLLVFKALALHNLSRTNESIECYEKASMVDPTLPLAWQGLISLYEDSKAEPQKFVRPLESLIPILKKGNEQKKHFEFLKKLLGHYEGAKMHQKAVELYEWLFSPEASDFYGDQITINTASFLLKYIKCREDQEEDHVNQEIQKRRFRLAAGPVAQIKATVQSELIQSSDLETWYEKALNSDIDPDLKQSFKLKFAKRLGGKTLFIDSLAEKQRIWQSIVQVEAEIFDEELFELVLDHSDCNQISEMKDHMEIYYLDCKIGKLHNEVSYYLGKSEEIVPLKSSLFSYWCWSRFCLKNEKHEDFLACVTVLNTLLTGAKKRFATQFPIMDKTLSRDRFLALVRCSQFEAASLVQNSFDDSEVEFFNAKSLIFRNLGQSQNLIDLLSKAVDRNPTSAELHSDLGWEYFKLKNLTESKLHLSKAVELDTENASVLFRLGKIFWLDESSHQDALEHWLRAIKADPNHSESFLALGHYYLHYSDLVRAEKCFQKALRLDGDLVEAAVSLAKLWISKVWNNISKHHEAGQNLVLLLESFTVENLRNWQLWKYLGIGYKWTERFAKAITAFQNALKTEGADEVDCLLLLAEAYKKEKKMSAALKAYERALEVQPELIIAKIGLASVNMDIFEFEKAIEILTSLFPNVHDGKVLAAIKSLLAKCHSLYSSKLVQDSEFDLAFDHCFQAMSIALENVSEGSVSLFRTISRASRACPLFSKHQDYSKLSKIISKLLESIECEDFLSVNHLIDSDSEKLAIVALSKLMKFESCSDPKVLAELWLELGQVLMSYAYNSGLDQQLLQKIEFCTNQSLLTNNDCPEAWNLHGLVTMEQGRYPLAQHSFVKALELAGLEMSHIWINLALLYLRLGDIELVQQAIGKAQMADVDNPLVWYSSAQLAGFQSPKAFELLAEAMNCSKASSMIDVNRSYSCIAWNKLNECVDENRSSVLNGLELSLKRLYAIDRTQPYFDNLYGLVLELNRTTERGLLVKLFSDALENSEHKSKVMNNYYRSLVCNGEYEKASEINLDTSSGFLHILRSIEQANVKNDCQPLESCITQALLEANQDLWELAIWQLLKLKLRLSLLDCSTFDLHLSQSPESLPALVGKMLLSDDPDSAEALLLQALEVASSSAVGINPEIVWVLASYLVHKTCYTEAFQFYIAVLEPQIMDPSLRETFSLFYGEFQANEEISKEAKDQVVLVIKEWLDVQVPQLAKKPKLEDLEAWYDRLFPLVTIESSLIIEDPAPESES